MLVSQRDPGGWYYTFKPLYTERAIDCSQGSKPFENPAAHRYKHQRQTSVTAHRMLLEMEAPCERSLLAMACDRALTEMRVFKATWLQCDKTKAGAVRSGLTGVPASQLHNERLYRRSRPCGGLSERPQGTVPPFFWCGGHLQLTLKI